MAKLNIRKVGDPVLRGVSRPVDEITPKILTLLDDMAETMRAANGVGLAAPQVGILRRIVVIECEEGQLIELINPKIIASSGTQEGTEGCLSLPGQAGITCRPMYVTVKAFDRNGKEFMITGEGLLAKAFCHELDHLDGKLYTDVAIRMIDEDEFYDAGTEPAENKAGSKPSSPAKRKRMTAVKKDKENSTT